MSIDDDREYENYDIYFEFHKHSLICAYVYKDWKKRNIGKKINIPKKNVSQWNKYIQHHTKTESTKEAKL